MKTVLFFLSLAILSLMVAMLMTACVPARPGAEKMSNQAGRYIVVDEAPGDASIVYDRTGNRCFIVSTTHNDWQVAASAPLEWCSNAMREK